MGVSMQTMTKKAASIITGGVTQTTKMPCKSYSLPTAACRTGYRMAQVKGSICASCYANKGNYRRYENNILPAQMARLDSLEKFGCHRLIHYLLVSGLRLSAAATWLGTRANRASISACATLSSSSFCW